MADMNAIEVADGQDTAFFYFLKVCYRLYKLHYYRPISLYLNILEQIWSSNKNTNLLAQGEIGNFFLSASLGNKKWEKEFKGGNICSNKVYFFVKIRKKHTHLCSLLGTLIRMKPILGSKTEVGLGLIGFVFQAEKCAVFVHNALSYKRLCLLDTLENWVCFALKTHSH